LNSSETEHITSQKERRCV